MLWLALDSNVFLQIFGRKQPFHPLLRALLDGRITLALSTAILLEYEEVTVQLAGPQHWQDIARLLELPAELQGNLRPVEPQFWFGVVTADPDDNKFCDCAIAAEADYVVTEDCHFDVLKSAGYKPRPVTPQDFIRDHLAAGLALSNGTPSCCGWERAENAVEMRVPVEQNSSVNP